MIFRKFYRNWYDFHGFEQNFIDLDAAIKNFVKVKIPLSQVVWDPNDGPEGNWVVPITAGLLLKKT